MELIKRYVYAVTRELPVEQRKEIDLELNGLISDMLDARAAGAAASEASVNAVLSELGDPKLLAEKYRGYQRYLIGPRYYDNYVSVLKIVLMAVTIAMVVVSIIRMLSAPADVVGNMIDFFSTIVEAGFQGAVWVTVVFVIMEYVSHQQGKDVLDTGEKWSVADLPELSDNSNQVDRVGSIIGLGFSILFFVLVTTSLHLFGIYTLEEGQPLIIVHFFDLDIMAAYLPFLAGVLGFGILKDLLAIINGRWNVPLTLMDILSHALSIAMFAVLAANKAIWNSNFLAQLTKSGMLSSDPEAFQVTQSAWAWVTNWLFILLAVITAIAAIQLVIQLIRLKSHP